MMVYGKILYRLEKIHIEIYLRALTLLMMYKILYNYEKTKELNDKFYKNIYYLGWRKYTSRYIFAHLSF